MITGLVFIDRLALGRVVSRLKSAGSAEIENAVNVTSNIREFS